MNPYSKTVASIALRIATAAYDDEKHPDGCDISAGMFGTQMSDLIREIAYELDSRAQKIYDLECQISSLANRI